MRRISLTVLLLLGRTGDDLRQSLDEHSQRLDRLRLMMSQGDTITNSNPTVRDDYKQYLASDRIGSRDAGSRVTSEIKVSEDLELKQHPERQTRITEQERGSTADSSGRYYRASHRHFLMFSVLLLNIYYHAPFPVCLEVLLFHVNGQKCCRVALLKAQDSHPPNRI